MLSLCLQLEQTQTCQKGRQPARYDVALRLIGLLGLTAYLFSSFSLESKPGGFRDLQYTT